MHQGGVSFAFESSTGDAAILSSTPCLHDLRPLRDVRRLRHVDLRRPMIAPATCSDFVIGEHAKELILGAILVVAYRRPNKDLIDN